MNSQLIIRLAGRRLTLVQMASLATLAIARCHSNTSPYGARYAADAADWARKIPGQGFEALQACLNFAEASMREQALVDVIARQDKWLEDVARPYLEK